MAEPQEDQTSVEPSMDAHWKEVAFDRARAATDYVWRPHVYEGMFSHLPVAEGEPWPWGIAAVALRSVRGMAEQFKMVVPDFRVANNLNDEGFSVAEVACHCGEVHAVEIGTIITTPCERAFYWFGQEVRVAALPSEDSSVD